jgi:hypothetical protein
MLLWRRVRLARGLDRSGKACDGLVPVDSIEEVNCLINDVSRHPHDLLTDRGIHDNHQSQRLVFQPLFPLVMQTYFVDLTVISRRAV